MKLLRIWGCWNGMTAGVIMNLRTPGLPRWHGPLLRIAPLSANRLQKSFCVLWKYQQSKNSDISWDTRLTFQVSEEWPLLQIPFHLLKQAAAACMQLLNDPFLFGTNATPSIRETNQWLNSVLKKNASEKSLGTVWPWVSVSRLPAHLDFLSRPCLPPTCLKHL